MKLHIAPLILMCLVMAAVPAMGDSYSNGPINGNVDAWTINFGFSVTDTFTFAGGGGMVNSLSFGVWLIPGDTITNVEVQIGTTAFGNNLYDGFVSLEQGNCHTNSYGYNVCGETGVFSGPTLTYGNYWLTLQNANVPSGDPVYWDENSGIGCTSPGCPSLAQETTYGTIPSESFSLSGGCWAGDNSPACGPTPEPGSLLLFGSGIVGLAAMLRFKMRW